MNYKIVLLTSFCALLLVSTRCQDIKTKKTLKSQEPYAKITAGFTSEKDACLAGGPLLIRFSVTNNSSKNFFLAKTGDRARRRPGLFTFEATFDNDVKTAIEDPLKNTIDIGGPATTIVIKPGENNSDVLVLNQFLSLEKLHDILKDGENGLLTVHCSHPLPEAYTKEAALILKNDKDLFKQVIQITVTRNDAELKMELQRITDLLKNKWAQTYGDEAALLVDQLTSIKIPLVLPYLEALKNHPNAIVKEKITTALNRTKKTN